MHIIISLSPCWLFVFNTVYHLSFSLLAVCLQYSVIYGAIYITTLSLGIYFIDSVLPFCFTVLYLFIIQ